MQISVCHYSFHRTWAAEGWDTVQLAEEVAKCGASAIDFHAGLLGTPTTAVRDIAVALGKTGLKLSALSLSNNFGHDEPGLVQQEIEKSITWMHVAKEVGAPVVRVFGSPLPSGLVVHNIAGEGADAERQVLTERIAAALAEITAEAENLGLVLALENHYGIPATGAEQAALIKHMNSKCFRATVDVGNYMSANELPENGTRLTAPYAAYVHVKDFVRESDESIASGWKLIPCAVGSGEIDQAACLRILKAAGYEGFVAVEYEGSDDERIGIAQSVEYLKPLCNGVL